MTDLPAELVICILEQLYYDKSTGLPDWRTLRACSLVSPTWTEPSQKMLFHAVVLRDAGVDAFIRATDPASAAGARLGSYVRRLDVRLGFSLENNPAQDILTLSNFITILNHCPRLYELTLRVFGFHQFDEPTMSTLTAFAASPFRAPLRALNLLRCGVQSPILFQLLAVFPTIRFLCIGMELVAPPPQGPASFSLTELVLYRFPSPPIVSFLLSASSSTLAILDVRDMPDPQLAEILAPHGPCLRALRVLRHNSRSAALIRLCPALEELVLFQLSTFLPLVGLPETLEHLSFRNYAWSSSPTLQRVIAAIDTLPRLRIVTCDVGTATHVDYPALQRKCTERGIELTADALPISTMEDPVPVRRFPRRKSISNFRLMNEENCAK